tara:strand:+ start:2768 stop:2896 length:129 start_codon:yes stop_codon:yes gene_type:complete
VVLPLFASLESMSDHMPFIQKRASDRATALSLCIVSWPMATE